MNTKLIPLAAAIVLAAAPIATVSAADIGLVAPQPSIHAAGYGFAYDFGSKHAVGTFARAGETCSLTLVISDRAGEDDMPAMGSRLQFAVAAGTGTSVTSPEGLGLQVDCSADARHVVVKPLGEGI